MTLDEAREAIGRPVIYRARHVPPSEPGEEGVITGVSARFVFVRYGRQECGIATPAELLEQVRAR